MRTTVLFDELGTLYWFLLGLGLGAVESYVEET